MGEGRLRELTGFSVYVLTRREGSLEFLMFRSGDRALVRSTGETVTVTGPGEGCAWRCADHDPVDEADLQMAHPTVLATIQGRHLGTEKFRAEMAERTTPNLLGYEIRDALETGLQTLTKHDLRGHWKSGEALDEDFRHKMFAPLLLSSATHDEGDAQALLKAIESGIPLDRFVNIGHSMSLSSVACSFCGAKWFSMETDGQVLRLAGDPCPYPEGFGPTEWELNVPSGRIVVANDLRQWFPLPEGDGDIASINTILGCQQTALAYAAVGMSHASVGNTCPGVYKLSDRRFKIANPPAEERWNGKQWVPVRPKPKIEGTRVAGICTDLWWYSLCDADEFKRRCEKFGGSLEDARAKVIKVRPGVYRFRHDEEARGRRDAGEVVYASFEWVREPDPVRDYLSEYEDVEVNAHAYVQMQTKQWPTLFGSPRNERTALPWSEMSEEQRCSAWQRVADQAMCVIGSGTDWHEKGFPQSRVDPTVLDVAPPKFRAQHHWYPFSRTYGGLFRETLSSSFARLAFEVLESVISFGTDVRDGERCREVDDTRQRMMLAVERYREMAALHPSVADPEFLAWVTEEGRAERWVAAFDLGPKFTNKHKQHIEQQKWFPEGAYGIAFDARKLKDGGAKTYFAWHPKKGGTWARKQDAQRFAIEAWSDNQQEGENNCFWTVHATNTSMPLYVVARVTRTGTVSHMGDRLLEVAFDYGTDWMRGDARKGLCESHWKDGILPLSREEYEALLPEAERFYEESEAAINLAQQK